MLKITKTTDYFKTYWKDGVNTSYLRRLFAASSNTQAKWSPHDLRHYFARQLYQKTKDILKVQMVLNHSSIITTAIYLKDYFNLKV